MIDLANFRDKLSYRAQEAISIAIEESQQRKHFILGEAHLFYGLCKIENTFLDKALQTTGATLTEMGERLEEYLATVQPFQGGGMQVPSTTRRIFQNAWDYAQKNGRTSIATTDLLQAFFEDTAGFPMRLMRIDASDQVRVHALVQKQLRMREQRDRDLRKRYELPPYLKQFAVNLNDLAVQDKLPPIIGREEEMNRLIEVLCHKERSNSAMLIGEAGVGKTAVVEGLARRLELDPESVPERMRDKQILNLQMNSLVAGTMFRGMFEDRIEKILKELRAKPSYVIFVDEVHTIIGTGSALGVPSDAANILKSALARGEIQMIGATTTTEYRQFILEDEALARRFRPVMVREPSLAETRKILTGIVSRYERNYNVQILPEAIDAALELSVRYNRGLRLPDKVIGWLDTACVKAEIADQGAMVGREHVVSVIGQESNIPAEMITRKTSQKFEDFERSVGTRIVGQREAIARAATRLRLNKGPLKENFNRPDGVFLFLGPTGVGKTEMAKAIAHFLFGEERRMIRVDMSEYQTGALSVDKLIGMPRGIVGSDRGGILTNRVREEPYSVVLLDEIDKADKQVLNLFLQVFDEGWLTDGRGKKVWFSDAIVIMTSNMGSDIIQRNASPLGFRDPASSFDSLRRQVVKRMEEEMTPEFINRIDDVVVFQPLLREEVEEIARRYLEQIARTMLDNRKELHYGEEIVRHLAETGFSIKYGARFLKRRIDELVKLPITLAWEDADHFVAALTDDGQLRIVPRTAGVMA